jgi:CRP-like cAMP-binding protein
MSGVEDAIAKVPLFERVSKRDLRKLASSMRERTFPAGSVVTEIGDQGVAFFIIDDGTATVTVNDKQTGTLKAGDHFGEIALIDDGPRTAKVTADTDLKCYGMSAWDFRPFVKSHPDVAWALVETLASRLRENMSATGQ